MSNIEEMHLENILIKDMNYELGARTFMFYKIYTVSKLPKYIEYINNIQFQNIRLTS